MATLVLLIMLNRQPFAEEASAWVSSCQLAIESFTWMSHMKPANTSRIICQSFVDAWASKEYARDRNNGIHNTVSDIGEQGDSLEMRGKWSILTYLRVGIASAGFSETLGKDAFTADRPTPSTTPSLGLREPSGDEILQTIVGDSDAIFNEPNFMGNTGLDWTHHFEFGVGNMDSWELGDLGQR